ncbi:MAG: helix-turn-helix transcriptional regulator [Lentisphaeria bacterium]|nr:helix-turn-helix transcriptional regulator [Lentisphaeria bacterium]
MKKFKFSGRIITSYSRQAELQKPAPDIMEWLKNQHHKHEFKEIMAVVDGTCFFNLKNKTFQLNPGDIVLLNSMESHTEGHYPEKNSVFWWGSFWTDMLRIHLWEENKIADSEILSMGTFNDFIYHLWDEIPSGGNAGAEEELAHIITALINHFLRNGEKEKHTLPKGMQYEIMAKIIDYIDHMPSLNCTLDSLALLAGYSKVHFQRRFAEYTGMVFREYLLRKRVDRYFKIIINKDFSLKEMAYELGFSSSAALLHWKQRNQKKFHL